MVKSFKKAIAIIISVLMISTSLPFTALTASAAESEQLFGYVTVDPIVYIHGTNSQSVNNVSDKAALDFTTYGDRIADATYAGECKTSVSSIKEISSVQVLDTSNANVSISNGMLTGTLGGNYSQVTSATTDSTVTLKFNFSDGNYEVHKLAVKTNPVPTHVVGSTMAWNGTGYRRGSFFEVVAVDSYGSSEGVTYERNSTRNKASYFEQRNLYNIYDPYGGGLNWSESNGLPSIPGYSSDKTSGYFAEWSVNSGGTYYMTVTSGIATYYVDKSQGNTLGIKHTAGSNDFYFDIFEGNFYTTGNYPKNYVKNSQYYSEDSGLVNDADSAGTLSISSGTPNEKAVGTEKCYSTITLKGTANGTGVVSGSYQIGYRGYNGSDYGGTRIKTRVNVVVSDKTDLRNYYNSLITNLHNNSINLTCVTSESKSNFLNAILTAEEYLNDNTDTSSVSGAKSALETAYNSLVEKHDYEETTSEVKATCKAGGVTAVMTCKNCGKTTGGTATEKDSNNHINIVDINAVAPTCGKDGTTAGKKCNDCGTVTVEPQVDPATGEHTPGTEVGAVTKPATKTETGVMTYTTKCTVCEKVIDSLTRTEVIPVAADTAKTVTFIINGEEVTREVNVGDTPVAPEYTEKTPDADYHYTYAWDKEFTEVTAEDENITYTLIETPVAHTPVTDEAQAPTHFASGLTEGSHCSVCNYVIVAQQVDPQIEHSYVLDKTSADYVAATCETPGMDVFVCSCGDTYKQPTSSLGHSPADAVKEDLDGVDEDGDLLNCEIAGSYKSVVYCSVCTEIISSDIITVNSTKHTNSVVVVNPTCTEDGYKYEKCTVCGYVNPTNIPVIPFVIDNEEYAYPSAIKSAVSDGNSQEFTYNAADAKFIDHIVIKFNSQCDIFYNGGIAGIGKTVGTLKVYDINGTEIASYQQKQAANVELVVPGAYARLVLSNANSNTYGYSIDSITAVPKLADGELVDDYKALGHDMQNVEGSYVAVTCTTDGKNADQKCSRCDYATTGATITAPGHSFTNYVSNNDATCQKNATQTATCDNCDATDTKEIADSTVDHSYKLTSTVEATHTENGKNVYTCKWCGDVMEEPIIAAGHTAGTPTVEDAVNVDANGVATSCDPTLEYSYNLVTRCTECTEIMTSVPTTVDPLAHTEVIDEAIEADCITVGYTEGKHCSVCETVIVAQKNIGKDATKHVGTVALDESTVVAATEEEAGYTGDKICDACNEVAEAGQEIPALGYTITFKVKSTGESVANNFPVGTTADELRAWAVENAPVAPATSTSHFSWSAYTNADMVEVAKNATYTMTTASDKGAIRHTYDDSFSEVDGQIIRAEATCKGCDYVRPQARMEASYTDANGDEVYAINFSSAITEAVKLTNSTVKVYGDVDYTVTAIKSISASDRTVTIDLNGATVTAPNGLKLAGSGAWVITGDGTITTGETNKSVYTVAYTGSGSLTIENGTFVSDKDEEGEGNATIFMNSTSDSAKIVVNGGTFDGVPFKGKSYVLNKLDGSKGTIEVNGGTFIGYNPLTDDEVTVDASLLADDSVAGQYTVVDGTDYIEAFNDAKIQGTAINEAEYTAESYAALTSAMSVTPARTTSAYNAATAAILTAIDELVKENVDYTITVNVQVDGEPAGSKIYEGKYADTATIDIASMLTNAKPYKWTIEQNGSTTKIGLTDSVYEMYITGDATVTVYASKTVNEDATQNKITILDKSGKTIGVSYVSAETTLNKKEETIAGVTAPKVAFYTFSEWVEVKPNVFKASYDLPAPTCNIHLEDGLVLVKNEEEIINSYVAYYDEVLNVKSDVQLAISSKADHSDAVLVKYNSLIHAPKANDAYIFIAPAELVASAQVTGIYKQDSSASFNVIVNASDYEIIECGIYAVRSADAIDNSFTFSKNSPQAVKIRSNTQSENGEFTITINSKNSFAGYKTVYGMPYVVYNNGGELVEVTGSVVGIIVNE